MEAAVDEENQSRVLIWDEKSYDCKSFALGKIYTILELYI